ncbi:P-type DNA transfer ATPase VirB11 [Phenylobacterium sp.]|jgi:type IV secretion system protein VirB11|uniref:P-type DNA transfer ATPase VirB11 n=1 Tax=Phenylobacterium sp. TaxID=1871053 RepID=UPI0025FBD274|nr:P-type DNA transfer ATPase VirB11 [Phenylobacterium sp.]MCA6288647.1 P-type DNA transfer ATPase VirB11 [Phenylobacterium sp.]MCA6310199.1 P-type DNA transfer ATPase VirB11 [Phenylobacterium sp.]MCA6322391.1 P-type DNA transfer ATPase VirB11 [Phenylobacterium sp.]MCA6338167.1 P-type DNA transfer ATPase VirB11 [Phenylobacterium sp.]MCA6340855.1 P-type DNA transfer ATPase VirB11 [Phenylobacterium sp.]
MNANVYLGAFLAPLAPWLSRPEVTDLLVNAPGEVWVETAVEGMRREAAVGLDETTLQRLVRQIAAYGSQGVNREQPLLSATLPDGARVQVVAPPATRGGTVLAVRKHLISDLSLEELSGSGLFNRPEGEAGEESDDEVLADRLDDGDRLGFLREAVRRRKTIVISGGTGSGKTTLLNALVKEIDASERLVVIEDAAEVRLDHPNSVGLIAVRGDMGEARVDADALLAASLRLRPDRILLGELRGSEAFAFLRAVNSGHPGSITTIHADSPAGALDQIGLLALTSGLDLGWDKVQAYVSRVIDVVVQIDRAEGVRRISDIQFLGRRA